ncbi:MAG TPA: efflux RND transporter periplasmic adaptor subunit [Candidatus Saccharimonadales bacterium]|jgi:HlyD family secretion protein|nr:efflux RND transporter periplasmic adaptor subunit [Candidatus Saccharimonadales bacterium]
MGRISDFLKNIWLKSMTGRALLVAPPVALILWLGYVTVGARTPTQYFTAKVEHGDISQVVQATGTINPVNTVPVGSVVSGNVVSVSVDFNSQVKKGDVLAQIDPVPFQIALAQAEASYQNSVANVANLEAQIGTSTANVSTMKANVAKAHATTIDMGTQQKRTKLLADQGVLSAQQNDDAQANYDQAVASENAAIAQEKQAESQLAATVAQRDQAKAQVQIQNETVKSAKLELSYCTIVAPIDGTVINRTVNVGQPVAASLQAPNLFSIGQDLKHMLVYSNTDEADVGRIKVGKQASFRVDSFPRETFNGTVAQVRMNATTIQNVVTYNTMVAFDNLDLRLFPGMTAYISIPVSEAKNVVKIPNGALRFKPDMSDSDRTALYAKYGITDTARATAAGRVAAAAGDTPGASGSNSNAPANTSVAAQAPGGQGRQGGAGGGGGGGRRAQGGAGGAGADGGDQTGARSGSGGGSRRQDSAIVWKLLPNKELEPVQVTLGVTDFTFTELVNGKINQGDDLIIGQSTNKSTTAQAQTRNPVGGGPAGGNAGGVPRRF